MTITEFLLARIAEDEEVAVATRDSHDPLPWTEDDYPSHLLQATNAGAWHMDGPVDGPSGYASIVIDPARVLAECEAKRRIVERCRPQYAILYRESERLLASAFDRETVQTVGHGGPMWPFVGAEDILRFLILPYADHPDYDPAWRVPAE